MGQSEQARRDEELGEQGEAREGSVKAGAGAAVVDAAVHPRGAEVAKTLEGTDPDIRVGDLKAQAAASGVLASNAEPFAGAPALHDATNPAFSLPDSVGAQGGETSGSSPAQASPRPFYLVVVGGPAVGARVEGVEEFRVGRSPENSVHLPDQSVSRRHASLSRHSDDSFLVKDLGSGNGTVLNGERLSGEAIVRHGDLLVLGDSTLRLVDSRASASELAALSAEVEEAPEAELGAPMAPAPIKASPVAETLIQQGKVPESQSQVSEDLTMSPVEAAKASAAAPIPKGRKVLYLSLVVVLVALTAVGILLKGGAEKSPVQVAISRSGPSKLEELVEEGKQHARNRRWEEAIEKFQEAKSHSSSPEIERLIKGSQAEAAHQKAVEQVREQLERGSLAGVVLKLEAIPETADFYEDAQELIAELPAAIDRLLASARQLLAEDNRDRAKVLVSRVLEVEPGHVAALALLTEIERKPEPVRVVTEKPAVRQAVAAPQPVEAAPVVPAGPSPEAVQALLAGDMNQALRLADSAGGEANTRLAQNLRSFDVQLREGLTRVRNERYLEAVAPLTKAVDLHREMSGGKPGRLGNEASKQLANAHYLLGLDSKGDDQLPRASRHFRSALRADPSHSLAKRQLSHVKGRADNLYIDAYTMESMDKEKAKRLYKLVVETMVPGEETYEKAKRRLDAL